MGSLQKFCFCTCGNLLLLILSNNMSLAIVTDQNSFSVNRNSRLKTYLIQKEINHTMNRLNPFLNTWILLAVLIPSAISVTILIWFFREAQHAQACRQNLEADKEEMLDKVRYMTANAQDIVDELDTTVNLSEQKIEVILSHIESLSIEDEKNSGFTVERNGKYRNFGDHETL